MTVRKIVLIGDPILRAKCQPVASISSSVLKLLDDLKDTLYAEPGRAGLAAPQIGIAKRVAVLDCGEGLIELINPELVETSGHQIGHEACLSIPNITGKVKRARKVKVKTLTRTGEKVIFEYQDYTAVCIQHEVDHLDGKLFIDHVRDGDLFHDVTGEKLNPLDLIFFSKTNRLK